MTLDTEDGKVLGTTNREMKDLNGRLLLVSNDDYCDSKEYKEDIKNHLEKENKEKKDKDNHDQDNDNDDDDDDKDKDDNGKSNNKSSGDDKSDQSHSSVKEVFEDAIIKTSEEDREGKSGSVI